MWVFFLGKREGQRPGGSTTEQEDPPQLPPGPNEKQNPQRSVRLHLEQEVEENIQENSWGFKADCELQIAQRTSFGCSEMMENVVKIQRYVRTRVHGEGGSLGVLSFL